MKILNFIYCFLIISLFISCEEEPLIYNDSQIGIETSKTSFTFLRVGDNQPVDLGARTILIGENSGTVVNYSFEVLPSSTAIEGLHYNLTSNSSSIAANEYFDNLPIQIIPDNIELGENLTLVVKMSNADVNIASNFDEVTFSIGVTCESDIAGTYSSVASGGTGDGEGGQSQSYSDLPATVTLTETEESGVYTIDDMSFGLYPIGYNDTAPEGRIQDICGTLSGLGDTDQYNDPFTISGSVDGSTGVITISWSNTYGDSGTAILTPQ